MTLKTQPFADNENLARMMGALPPGGGRIGEEQLGPPPQEEEGKASTTSSELSPEQAEKIRMNARKMDELISIYRQNGFMEEAEGLEQRYFGQVLTIAQLNTKMAENVWNESFLVNKYGPLTLRPEPKIKTMQHEGQIVTVDERTGKIIDVDDLGKHQEVGGSLYFIKNGIANEIITGKPQTEDFVVGSKQEKRQWNKTKGRWERIPGQGGPRWKEGEGATGKGGATAHKNAQKGLEDFFIQNYAGMINDAGTVTDGKAPDFNTLMAFAGKTEIQDRRGPRTGKPLTIQGLYGAATTYLEDRINEGMPEKKALQATIDYMNKFGMTNYAKADLTPEQEEDLRSGRARAYRDKDGKITIEPTNNGGNGRERGSNTSATLNHPNAKKESRYQREKREAAEKAKKIRSRPSTFFTSGGKRDPEAELAGYVNKKKKQASPEAEAAEIEARVKFLMRHGVPEKAARERAQKTISPKYKELRRILADYLGEDEAE